MAKTKTVYICSNCGTESPKWIGKCFSCGEWNTFVVEVVKTRKNSLTTQPLPGELTRATPIPVSGIDTQRLPRINTGIEELNRELRSRMVPRSIILMGGEPG